MRLLMTITIAVFLTSLSLSAHKRVPRKVPPILAQSSGTAFSSFPDITPDVYKGVPEVNETNNTFVGLTLSGIQVN